MKRYIISILVCLFLLSLFFDSHPAIAAPYYKGKVITLIVGYGAGGGYDRIARVLAKNLSKFIPGEPTILVQNMPGADTVIAANYLYNIAKPDGLTIGSFNRGLVFAQLLKSQGVKFDLTKFAWIGSAAKESTVLCLRADLPYKTIEDVAKAKSAIVIGTTGPTDSSGLLGLFLKELLGYNFKHVIYPSGPDIILAIQRKEVDAIGKSYSSARIDIAGGLLVPVMRGRVMEMGIEKLPVDEDLAKGAMEKTLMAMRSAPDSIGRPYVAPPGTPEATMNVLRNAFAKVAKDPVALEDARKSMMALEYVPAQEVQKVLQYMLNQPPHIVKEFGKYVKF